LTRLKSVLQFRNSPKINFIARLFTETPISALVFVTVNTKFI
jgi:hypothetical protein